MRKQTVTVILLGVFCIFDIWSSQEGGTFVVGQYENSEMETAILHFDGRMLSVPGRTISTWWAEIDFCIIPDR